MLKAANIFTPELAITILIVAAVVILLIGLAITATIFRGLRLANKQHPMGLPEGSIRAVIALGLIILTAECATTPPRS